MTFMLWYAGSVLALLLLNGWLRRKRTTDSGGTVIRDVYGMHLLTVADSMQPWGSRRANGFDVAKWDRDFGGERY